MPRQKLLPVEDLSASRPCHCGHSRPCADRRRLEKRARAQAGSRVGKTVTVCTDNQCPVHDPRAKARQASNPVPVIAPATEDETEEEAEERKRNYEEQRKE